MKKSYNFSTISFADLEEITNINMGSDEEYEYIFDEWFTFPYDISDEENQFLERLIKKHHRLLPSYSEEKLKMRFLAILLDKVDFSMGKIQDWYDAKLSGVINQAELNGFIDFMVAQGTKTPHKPYFFIQEFKPQQASKDVEDQLLAEMLVAIEHNDLEIMRGAYVIGQWWKFVIVQKVKENTFDYFVSQGFDALKIHELTQIYLNLQTIKLKYCKL